jgi:hypothetical protein
VAAAAARPAPARWRGGGPWPWQRQLNELGGVKPLAFGQYGELGPGFEQFLVQQLLSVGGGRCGNEAAKRYLIPNAPRSSGGSAASAAACCGSGCW